MKRHHEADDCCRAILRWIRQQTNPLRTIAAAISCVMLVSGCQSTQEHGLLRVWADVNSLGAPAAFVDDFRTDAFRPRPPETGLPVVETLDIGVASHSWEGMQPDLIPLSDPVGVAPDQSHGGVPLCPPESTDDAVSGEETSSDVAPGNVTPSDVTPAAWRYEPDGRSRSLSEPANRTADIVPPGAWLF